ncbi:acyl-CoA dehydrogenase family protein [Actinocrispum wychmicini]|uniref:Alkylation response protein AidB-like acyl-CoA dehydrogenase n=1 Tax=Actinocrispum wychmicini TaxID=1213861 RepID=A0A4R2JPH8_9PSEU|nr:acyl-CoA dehydrogenase family protein [Actinocrispum wychmicini]TCO56075.1 alkylation response protein AidB-like acyl-CoA dehydrogenase [Actinocrispum wychmicini]
MSVGVDLTHLPDSLADVLRAAAEHTVHTGLPDDDALLETRKSGLFAVGVPVEHGGAGGDAAAVNEMVEQVARVNPSVAIILFQHFAVSARIAEWGTPDQQADLLPRLASGELLAASAWSEPGAGAAKKRISTTALRLPGDRWLLDGAKSFTTGATVADLYLVLARTGPADDGSTSAYGSAGQSFFLVRADNPGLCPDLGMDLAGMRGSATGFVSLRQCEVPDADRLGPLGGAPRIISGVRESGLTLGAVSVGIAQALLDLAARQVAKVDTPIARRRLVDLATQVEAVRAMVTYAGQRVSAAPGLTTLHSKLFASAVAEQVGAEVARLIGSAGYVTGHEVNRLIADARAVALMGPTNELCRELVSHAWNL